jgi:flagellar basal body rod protein FlgG
MQMLENISEHLAAAKTPGYKKGVVTFEARLGEATSGLATKATNYSRLSRQEIDFTPGHIEYSGDPLDLAINGDGFFRIERADGSFGYTRKGNFQLNGDGRLVDTNGYAVTDAAGGEIVLPHPDVDILPDGTIWDGETRLAQVGLFRFDDRSVLRKAGGEMFVADEDVEPELQTDSEVVQSNLEASNIDTQKALKVYSDMGAKASEIGLVQ